MISFKEYLKEERDYDIPQDEYKSKLSLDEAIELIKTKCSDSIEQPLYRGMQGRGYFLIQGEKGGRKSDSITNHYTLIIDEMLKRENSKYPLRSKSIICTTSSDYANNFGVVYVIFPFNETKIGVVPKKDIWDLTIEIDGDDIDLDVINEELLNNVAPNPTSYQDIVEKISKSKGSVFDMLKNTYISIFGENKLEGKFDSEAIDELLSHLYNPENLGLEFGKYSQINVKQLKNNEVWIGGKVIAIPLSDYLENKEKIEEM